MSKYGRRLKDALATPNEAQVFERAFEACRWATVGSTVSPRPLRPFGAAPDASN